MTVSAESTQGAAPSGTSGAGLLRSAVRRDIVDTLADLPERQRADGLSARELRDLVGCPFIDDDQCLARVTTRTFFAPRGGTA